MIVEILKKQKYLYGIRMNILHVNTRYAIHYILYKHTTALLKYTEHPDSGSVCLLWRSALSTFTKAHLSHSGHF